MAYKREELQQANSAAAEETSASLETGKHKQKKADPGEKERRENAMETQGRRGCKLGRMNLSLSPENFEYVRTRARMDNTTLSKTVNNALTEARVVAELNGDYLLARNIFRRYDAEKENEK